MKKEISNRGFIFLRYKEPYRLWASKWNELDLAELESHLGTPKIYMVDFVDPDDPDSVNDVIEENYKIIFEAELMSWNSIEKEWPNNITHNLFNQWFDYVVTNVGYDLVNDQLAYD